MHIREFEFDLPSDLVAQEPSPERDDARLMYLPRDGGQIGHFRIADLPRLLRPGDLIVVHADHTTKLERKSYLLVAFISALASAVTAAVIVLAYNRDNI